MNNKELKAHIDIDVQVIPKPGKVIKAIPILVPSVQGFEFRPEGFVINGQMVPREQIAKVNILATYKDKRDEITVQNILKGGKI